METGQQFLALMAVIIGTLFSIIGVLGFYRLPDPYTRLHAVGKVGVFGVVLLLVAAALVTPLGWGRALLLIGLLMLTGPVSAHAIASATYRIGIPLQDPVVDELAAEEINP